MPDFNRGEFQVRFKATPGRRLAETGERPWKAFGA